MSNVQSLVRSFLVQRADSMSVQHDPIQWSSGSQLAINNGNQLTILDPKLPSFDKKTIQIIDSVKLLDSKPLFQATNILHPEVIRSLSMRKLNNITIETLDEPFNFRNINEPIIVSHKWSSINHLNRNNYLSVLFNTGELLVLERDSIYPDKSLTKIVVFDYLLRDFNIELRTVGKETYIDNSKQFMCLRIRAFDMGQDDNGNIYLSIATNNGDLLVYSIEQDKLVLKFKLKTDQQVVKLKWSEWIGATSQLAIVNSDNSVIVYTLTYESSKFLLVKEHTVVSGSRFLNSTVNWISVGELQFLLLTSTGKLKVVKYDQTKVEDKDIKLSSYLNVASVISKNTAVNYLQIVINFEDGKFESLALDIQLLETFPTQAEKSLNSIISKCLYSFQLTNSSNEDEEESVSTPPATNGSTPGITQDSGAKYLNQIIEGSFISYGSKLMDSGIISIVYRIIPKNLLHYETAAKNELQIAFITLDDFLSDNSLNTPLAYLNNMWISKLKELPVLGETLSGCYSFIKEVEDFKTRHFVNIDSVNIDEELLSIKSDSFRSALLHGLHKNPLAKKFQVLINFNKIFIDSLKVSEYAEDKEVQSYVKKFNDENKKVIHSMEILLVKLIFNYIALKKDELTHDIDKFLILKYAQSTKAVPEFKLPLESEILIGTKFFQESFKITIDDIEVEGDLIESTTNHKWSKCRLTNLPLMQLSNRKDELNQYNYILLDSNLMPSTSLTYQLLENIQYCYISGNKAYSA